MLLPSAGVSMEFKIKDSREMSYRLLKPPLDEQRKLFKYYVKIFRNRKLMAETMVSIFTDKLSLFAESLFQNETHLKIDKKVCGTNQCDVWMALTLLTIF